MNPKLRNAASRSGGKILALLLLTSLGSRVSPAFAQGTAFSYQGRLNAAGSPANGSYDFRFRLAADPLGNTYVGNAHLTNGIAVSNGLFTTTMDFGPGLFAGSNFWLEVDVRTNGAGSYTVLAPLQALTPAPYSIFANTASNLSGVLPAGQLSGMIQNGNLPVSPTFSGTVIASSFSGDGSGLTNLSASHLSNGTIPLPQLPAAVLTNNETSPVTFGNSLTLGNPTGNPVVYMPDGSILLLATTNHDLLVAPSLGSKVLTGPRFNTALGYNALSNNIDGSDNTAIGSDTLVHNTNGVDNTAIGSIALSLNTNGSLNTAVGYAALDLCPGGSNNIAVGFLAGSAFVGNESGNIDIGNNGSRGDNNTIRIGTPGTQTNTYIAGVVNNLGGMQVGNSGTTMTTIQSGQAIMPPSSLQETNFTITFPTAFGSSPKIIFSLANEPSFQGVSDVFAASVSSNSPAAFTVNVYRLNGTSWGQQLRVNWQAWQ